MERVRRTRQATAAMMALAAVAAYLAIASLTGGAFADHTSLPSYESPDYNVWVPYSKTQDTPTTAMSQSGRAGVRAFNGTFDHDAEILVDEDPPQETPKPPLGSGGETFSMFGNSFNVSVRNTETGRLTSGGDWDPPLEIHIFVPPSHAGVPDDRLVPFVYDVDANPHGWRAIPMLPAGATTLAPGAADGFHVANDSGRYLRILTRHLTVFAGFERTPATTQTTTTATTTQTPPPPPVSTPAVLPPAPLPPPPRVVAPRVRTTVGATLRVRRGRVRVPCLATGVLAGRCSATLVGARRRVLGTGSAALRAGRATVSVALNRAARRSLRRVRRGLKAALQLTVTGGRSPARLTRDVRLRGR